MSGGAGGIRGPGRIDFDPGFIETEPESAPSAPRTRAPDAPATGPTSSAWAVRAGLTAARPPDAAAAGRAASMPHLRLGSKGEAVKELQSKLNGFRAKLGLRPIPVEGTFGPKTQATVKEFQKLWGIDAQGNVGEVTWRRLLGEPNPKPSSPVPGTATAKVMQHREAILAASAKTGIPPAIICGMIEKESGGRADVVGITNDRGLVQINPDAHPAFFRRHDWKDPKQNLEYGIGLLKHNLEVFGGDVDKAVAAYNAGIGGVRKGLRNGRALDEITFKPHYVSHIERYAQKYQDFF